MERTNRTAWIGLGAVLLIGLVALSALGGGLLGHDHLFGYGARPYFGVGPWFWGIGLIGLVIRLAFWGVLITFGLSLFRRFSSRDEVTRSKSSSLEILKRRYAAGEITREQFEEMRKVLDPSV
jgi:putative membrane protein